jgi:hypothetical protein
VNYQAELHRVMKKLLLLGEVGMLSMNKKPADKNLATHSSFDYSEEGCSNDSHGHKLRKSTSLPSMQQVITEMLEEQEDPPECQTHLPPDPTVPDVLCFRRALDCIDNEFPFTPLFGRARTREECCKSSQQVFERLMKGSEQNTLGIQAICQIAVLPDGSLDRRKIRDLIQVFRPSRQGQISKMEFIQSTDRYAYVLIVYVRSLVRQFLTFNFLFLLDQYLQGSETSRRKY